MKCHRCEVCGEMVPYGDPIWIVDSVFENDCIYTCQQCAELYKGYPESLTRLTGDKYEYIEWVSSNEYNTKG
jgi:hypothetical protein